MEHPRTWAHRMNCPPCRDERNQQLGVQASTAVKVLTAKRQGRIKPQPCAACGVNKKLHAHHEDYTKPLEITWLCPKHHVHLHHQLSLIQGDGKGA